MEKILKFSSPRSPKVFVKRPPKINTETYYSEYEEDKDIYLDNNDHGQFVKVYTKKEIPEAMKPKYETDQEPNHDHNVKSDHSILHQHAITQHHSTVKHSNFKHCQQQKKRKSKRFRGDEAHSGDKIKKIYYKASKENFLKNHPFRHLIFNPNIPPQVFKKHLNMLYRGLLYAKNCLKGPSSGFLEKKQIPLTRKPESEGLKTLFLDLDETLIHSCSNREKNTFVVKTFDENNQPFEQAFKIRPYCREFLEEMSKIYEVHIFTASYMYYAEAIINFIDPQSKYIISILDRSKCLKTKNGFFIKDLRIIANRELKNMLIVDNLAHSFGFQIDNGVPILEWYDSEKDQELLYLKEYLKEAAVQEDVREFNKQKLKLSELENMTKEELHI